MSEGLTLKERAKTDPMLQRALSTYRTVGQSIARDYWKLSREAFETGGIAAVEMCQAKFKEVIASKAAEYEAEANIPGLGDQCIAYIDEELKRLQQQAIDRDPAVISDNATTDSDAEVRKFADDLVELHWRLFLSAAGRGDEDGARKLILGFERNCEENKAKIIRGESGTKDSPENFRKMVQYIEEARSRIADEYDLDPVALKRRLGVPVSVTASVPVRDSNRMGIGEMAVRTAVRATVWTVIRDLIRAILR
jgi:hypothetical protein